MSIVFGLLCQIPVVMIALHGVGIVTYQWIKTTRSYAYAGIITLVVVVAPSPDVPSLVMFAVPIIALYEICIWVIYFLEKRKPAAPVKPSVSLTPAAATPYVEPPANSGYDDPNDHDHYNDGHYHDEHYQREHPPEPEAKPAEPERKLPPRSIP